MSSLERARKAIAARAILTILPLAGSVGAMEAAVIFNPTSATTLVSGGVAYDGGIVVFRPPTANFRQ